MIKTDLSFRRTRPWQHELRQYQSLTSLSKAAGLIRLFWKALLLKSMLGLEKMKVFYCSTVATFPNQATTWLGLSDNGVDNWEDCKLSGWSSPWIRFLSRIHLTLQMRDTHTFKNIGVRMGYHLYR